MDNHTRSASFTEIIQKGFDEEIQAFNKELTVLEKQITRLEQDISDLAFGERYYSFEDFLNYLSASVSAPKLKFEHVLNIIEKNSKLNDFQKSLERVIVYRLHVQKLRALPQKLENYRDKILRLRKKRINIIVEHNLLKKRANEAFNELLTPIGYPLLTQEESLLLTTKTSGAPALISSAKTKKKSLEDSLKRIWEEQQSLLPSAIELFNLKKDDSSPNATEKFRKEMSLYENFYSDLSPLLTQFRVKREEILNSIQKLKDLETSINKTLQKLKEQINTLTEKNFPLLSLPEHQNYIQTLERYKKERTNYFEALKISLTQNLTDNSDPTQAIENTYQSQQRLATEITALTQSLEQYESDQTECLQRVKQQASMLRRIFLKALSEKKSLLERGLTSLNHKLSLLDQLNIEKPTDLSTQASTIEENLTEANQLIGHLEQDQLPEHELLNGGSAFKGKLEMCLRSLDSNLESLGREYLPSVISKIKEHANAHNERVHQCLEKINSLYSLQSNEPDLFSYPSAYLASSALRMNDLTLLTIQLDPLIKERVNHLLIENEGELFSQTTKKIAELKTVNAEVDSIMSRRALAQQTAQAIKQSEELALFNQLVSKLEEEMIRYPMKSLDSDPRRECLFKIKGRLNNLAKHYQCLQIKDKKTFVTLALAKVKAELRYACLEALSSHEQSSFFIMIRTYILRPLTQLLNSLSEATNGLTPHFKNTFFASENEKEIKQLGDDTEEKLTSFLARLH